MIEIKKCPFCGGEAHIDFSSNGTFYISNNGDYIDPMIAYIIKCDECGCGTCRHEDIDMAIEAWNKRVHENEVL